MTGFGRGKKADKQFSVEVEISSVNKRGLETFIALPRDLAAMEGKINEELKKNFERGKLSINIRVEYLNKSKNEEINIETLKLQLKKLRAACKAAKAEFDLDAELIWEMMSAQGSVRENNLASEETILGAVKLAIAQCIKEQTREGKTLEKDFAARIKKMRALKETAKKHSVESLPRQRERLLKNLANAGLNIDASDERVLKELAIFADRVDISEELTRIESHLLALEKLLKTSGAIGRPIEFLLQELLREWNTLGNKSVQVELVRTALEAKNEVERMREQAANVA